MLNGNNNHVPKTSGWLGLWLGRTDKYNDASLGEKTIDEFFLKVVSVEQLCSRDSLQ